MSEYQDYGYENNEPNHMFPHLRDALFSLLPAEKSENILDLGCGNGHMVTYLVENGYNAYGTDASEKGVAIGKQSYPERFFVQDLSTDELPVGLKHIPFKCIISIEVIEHLYDPNKFIAFCHKILPAGGELIISTPYHGYLKNLMLSVLNKWDEHINPLWSGGHIKFWSKNTLSRLLTESGFEVTGFKGCGRVPYFWMTMIIKAKKIV